MFEGIRYTKNKVYVHSDKKLMPESRKHGQVGITLKIKLIKAE